MSCNKNKYKKEFKKEKKEHPKLSNKVIGMIVRDHNKKKR